MFKSILNTLQRRKESLGRQEGVADITQQAVLEYLNQSYSETSARISVRYRDEDSTLTIITAHKALAGELSLHAPELRTYLVSKGVRVGRIVIR